jgi:hypothetical protein
MSVNNFIPDDGSLWSIRAVDISGNYNQKLNFDTSGNAIVRTGNTDRLTINSSGAWTCQGGMTYNNATDTLTAGTFSGNISVPSPYNFSVISIYTNSTARDAALPSPYTGQFCFLTGSNALQYYNSGAWTTYGGGVLTPVLPTISGFTLGVNYQIIYVDSGNTVVGAPVSSGFTIVRFYPTTTTSGTISLSQSVAITYLLVAGGGGGAGAITSISNGGGGGAGGYVASTDNMTASVSYALQVGGGGAGGSATLGTVGTNTNLAVASTTIIANGGGAGGTSNGGNGGSGGGGAATNLSGSTTGGTGSQGENGGGALASGNYYSGGGGGHSTAGSGSGVKGNGGNGTANTITGASVTYAGGGGGGSNDVSTNPATGGTGGGGNGGAGVPSSTYTPATAGTDGLGGGGGGGGQGANANVGFKGGAGIVIVRFPSFI